MTEDSKKIITLYPLWREAVKAFIAADYQPGDVVTHQWLYAHFGLEMPDDDMRHGKAKRLRLKRLSQFTNFEEALLKEHQIALRPRTGQGYEIVRATEQTAWAFADGIKTVRKSLTKMADRLLNVDHAQLSSDQRRANADALAKMAMLSGMAQRVTRQSLAQLADPAAPARPQRAGDHG
jgi:hypothetical protein